MGKRTCRDRHRPAGRRGVGRGRGLRRHRRLDARDRVLRRRRRRPGHQDAWGWRSPSGSSAATRQTRELVYGIVGGVPVVNHKATITVVPEGSSSHVTWDVEVDDEMTDMMHQMYQQSLQALKDHLTG